MAATPGTCDSCGDRTGDLTVVQRVYVTPPAWDAEGATEVRPGTERWCTPCRTSYPHLED